MSLAAMIGRIGMRKTFLRSAAFLWLAVAPAAASTIAEYEAARANGQAANTAEGFARACEAGLVIGAYLAQGAARVGALHRSIEDCARAIELGAQGPGPYVNYAIGLGFEAKRLKSRSVALRARRFFDEAAVRFPESGFANAGLAGWHSNVAQQGGIARIALGASRDEARRGFSRALELDRENIAISYEYLRFLASGDRKDRRSAHDVAARLLAAAPQDTLSQLLVARAAIIARTLSGPESVVDLALRETEPFAGVESAAPGEKFTPPFSAHFPPSTP